jgi:hypothetical protein
MISRKDIKEADYKKIFYFFHKKKKNQGNLETANWPSQATHYVLEITKHKYFTEIEEYELFKYANSFTRSSKLCKDRTNRSVQIYDNLDFAVGEDTYQGETDMRVYYKQTYRSYNILKFYKFLKSLGYKIKV